MALFPVTLSDPNYLKPPHFCHKPALYKTAEPNKLIWHISFTRLIHTVGREFGYRQKEGYFPLELSPKLWTYNISQLHVDPLRCCRLRWMVSVINW